MTHFNSPFVLICYSIGRSKFRQDTPKNEKNEHDFEPLKLSPSKLQKKCERLKKIYQRKALKEREKADALPQTFEPEEKPDLVVEAKALIDSKTKPKKTFMTDYEKNKSNNLKSNVELPTCSTAGSLESRSGGRNLYGYHCYFAGSPIKNNSSSRQNGSKHSNKSVKNIKQDMMEDPSTNEAVKGTLKVSYRN